jgi:hypothetical protein
VGCMFLGPGFPTNIGILTLLTAKPGVQSARERTECCDAEEGFFLLSPLEDFGPTPRVAAESGWDEVLQL